ncbi:hypothetical protein [Streptomyces sp. A5-4]|uniref:hypothetical protein n=1 Tax=Streptomyces sp. A5-4 TaxID=3384771 RepID=UPI003DA95DFA
MPKNPGKGVLYAENEKGKGGVGATLARRGKQGNLFVTVRGITYNVHIDIG